MYIQIDNAGFINKGAQLMLFAVIDRIKKEATLNPKFIAGLNCNGTVHQIVGSELLQIAQFYRFHLKLHKLFPQPILERYGMTQKEAANIIIDAGGFQFGDQWLHGYNDNYISSLENYYSEHKKRGCKIVFLPQAFGPFKDPLSRKIIELIHNIGDVFYAREETSFQYLKELFPNSDKIKLAPDFTCLVTPDLPHKLYLDVKDGVCIIPNAKMITHSNKEISDSYLQYLENIASGLINKGEKIIFLNHEGEGDWELIEKIIAQLGNSNNILALNKLNAYEIKAVIGNCKLLISSRFHGVVSGLSQQIPTFCTSWSHKYEELMRDYNLENNILNPLDIKDSIKKIELALNKPIIAIADDKTISQIKNKTETMWKEVIAMINK